MDKKRVAEILDEMGTILEIKGDNPFRTRAFHTASETVASLTEDLSSLIANNELTDLPGIGAKIAQIISDLVQNGTSADHESLRSSIPSGLLEMTRIQGLGPKRIKVIYDKLGVDSVAALKEAASGERLAELQGFGKKSAENILKGIERLQQRSGRRLYRDAKRKADAILESLKSLKLARQIEIAGSLRRKKELIGDIDIIAVCGRGREELIKAFISLPVVQDVIGQGDTKASVVLDSGINCDLRVVNPDDYPFALNYFTGSKEHNVLLRSMARDRGWSLNEYGFSRLDDDTKRKKSKSWPVCKTEKDLYRSFGLDYIEPELRENMGEVEAARSQRLPDLVTEKNLKGAFHCHTTYSDGLNSVLEMNAKAASMGWRYWGTADHSKSAVYARGLTIDSIEKQIAEIDKLNTRKGSIRIFKGIECDILADGSLDYSDDVLARFDYVIASIHSKLNMTKDEATKRIIKALKNRFVTFLGHPTGRVLLERDGYPLNIAEVIQAASDYGKGIEINSHPVRLDLDWRHLKYAKDKGVKLSINPDAHTADGLEDVRYGVGIARKGWLESEDVVNTWSVAKVEKYFRTCQGK